MSIVDFRPEEAPWTKDARCARKGAPSMYPHDQDNRAIMIAKEECHGCPVRGACLKYALDHGERFGVWGGTTADERKTIRRSLSRYGRD